MNGNQEKKVYKAILAFDKVNFKPKLNRILNKVTVINKWNNHKKFTENVNIDVGSPNFIKQILMH